MTPDHQAQFTAAAGELPSAPIHIIAYVDGRMREHTQHVEQILRDHVADEMCRFGEIAGGIKAAQARAEELELRNAARHAEIMAMLTTQNKRIDEIEQAFLKDHKGDPDYHGHHGDHDTRIRAAQRWDALKTSTTANVVTWASIAAVGWLSFAIWQAVKAGVVTP
jgi:hypothetical protein